MNRKGGFKLLPQTYIYHTPVITVPNNTAQMSTDWFYDAMKFKQANNP